MIFNFINFQPNEEQFTHLPSKTTFFDPRMLPEHHPAPTFNPQAIQTHYQHPAMAHAMVKKDKIYLLTKQLIAMFDYRTGDAAMMMETLHQPTR